jgi:hypothetical protein
MEHVEHNHGEALSASIDTNLSRMPCMMWPTAIAEQKRSKLSINAIGFAPPQGEFSNNNIGISVSNF